MSRLRWVGEAVGADVGAIEGDPVAAVVGPAVGMAEGAPVGDTVIDEGEAVTNVAVGAAVSVTLEVGAAVNEIPRDPAEGDGVVASAWGDGVAPSASGDMVTRSPSTVGEGV